MARIPASIAFTTGKTTVAKQTFALERTGARTTNDAQTKARSAGAVAGALPFGDGNLITGVSMSASSPVEITHKLGRAARGVFAVNVLGATVTRWVCTSLGSASTGKVTVVVDQTATVDWWVY